MNSDETESAAQTEQRFEYQTVKIGSQQQKASGVIDDYAEDGWQLVETLGTKGTSQYLVFERPVGRVEVHVSKKESDDGEGGALWRIFR